MSMLMSGVAGGLSPSHHRDPERSVTIAARMYECRATARTLLGEKFAERMRIYAIAIQAVARRKNITTFAASVDMAKEIGPEGAVFVLAAFVEMSEIAASVESLVTK